MISKKLLLLITILLFSSASVISCVSFQETITMKTQIFYNGVMLADQETSRTGPSPILIENYSEHNIEIPLRTKNEDEETASQMVIIKVNSKYGRSGTVYTTLIRAIKSVALVFPFSLIF